ncbi:hypothetical protein ACHAXR_012518 [Thalassiosira sp. AJA248-18]
MGNQYDQLAIDCSPNVAVAAAALLMCRLGGTAILPDPRTSTVAGFRLSKTVDAVIRNVAQAPTGKRKYTKKARDPKRDTSVSFNEMNRLMTVYGPIKCLRNRSSKEPGGAAKPDSIRRKFYRWFPKFNERFTKNSEGYYVPKAGHQEELQYRAELRNNDRVRVVNKKKITRRSKISSNDSHSA